MNRRYRNLGMVLTLLAIAVPASAAPVRSEHVTGGTLQLNWENGFGVSNKMKPLTLVASDPGFANPSGDHTVACATNSVAPDSGGIVLTCTEPAGLSDYVWEANFFTGEGNSRRGLVVRADPTNGFASHYQLTIKTGLLTVEFRKFINGNPTVTLGSWLTSSLPGGIPQANSWHSLKIQAIGPAFRCFFDGNELLPPPTPDSDLASGWVGVYNFRFDLGGIQALFDDLLFSPIDVTPTARESWGDLKARYVR